MVIFENENISYDLIDGIIICNWSCDFITLEIAQEIVSERLKVWGNESYPVISYIKDLKKTTKGARDFLALSGSCIGFSCCAIVSDSMIERAIASLFIQFNKPVVPVKLFATEKTAMQWLKTK